MRAFLGFVVCLSCADLPVLQRGTCGNAILESGEDCDTFPRAGFACRTSGALACRLECSSKTCPSGYGCGVDGICRRPSGVLDAALSRVAVDARRVELADFDADGRLDPFAQTPVEFRVHYFDGKQDPTRVTTLIGTKDHAVSSLSVPGAPATLATGDDTALNVWRGQTDRTLATTLYSALAVAPMIQDARFYVAKVTKSNPLVTSTLGEQFLFGSWNGTSTRIDFGLPDVMRPPMLEWSVSPSAVVGPAFGAFYPVFPCDVMAYADGTSSAVMVYPLCDLFGAPSSSPFNVRQIATQRTVKGLAVADVDGNGRPDLVIEGCNNFGCAVEVAYSNFAWFTSQPAGNGAYMKSQDLAPSLALGSNLLAAGDLDNDKIVDVVETAGIHLSSTRQGIQVPLTSAKIEDLNHDGNLDLIGINDFGSYFFAGTGSPLINPSFSVIDGRPSKMVVADFDGDSIDDILVASTIDATTSELSIQWGRPFQLPEPPHVIGTLPTVEDLAGGSIAPFLAALGQLPSSIAIAPILSRRDKQLEAPVLVGSTSRILQSPLAVNKVDTKGNLAQGFVVGMTTGRFLAADHESVALVANDSSSPPFVSRLWLAASSGDASMEPSRVYRSNDLLSAFAQPKTATEAQRAWAPGSMAAVDVDGMGLDALVMLGRPTPQKQGVLALARASASGFVLSDTVEGLGGVGSTLPWSVQAADVDADGAKDVIFLHDQGGASACKVIFNKRTGVVDPSTGIAIPVPTDTITDVAALSTSSTTSFLSLAVATKQHLYVTTWNGKGFTPLVELFDRDRSPIGATSITAGDVDGDGLDDVVVARDHAMYVYFQGEKLP